MQILSYKTQKGYAFECRKANSGEICLIESAMDYFGETRIITGIDSNGQFIMPNFLRAGNLIQVTDENMQTMLKGHVPSVIPVSKICVIVKATVRTSTQGVVSNIELYLPKLLEPVSEEFSKKRGKDTPCLYCEKLGEKSIVGMNIFKVPKDIISSYERPVADFFNANPNLKNKESFLVARLHS